MSGITSNPKITIQAKEAALVDAFADRRDLIVGQIGPGGTAVSGDLVTDVEFMNPIEIRSLFGSDELYHRILAWRSSNGGFSSLHVIALTESVTGEAAESEILFTGTLATAAGTYTISVVDEKKFTVSVAVEVDDTPTLVVGKIIAAFDALENYPVFDTSQLAGVVAFIAHDKGTIGNFYGLKVTGTVAGLSYALGAWTNGANDPVVTGIFDTTESVRYSGINWPEAWGASLAEVVDFLNNRFNASNNILDGVAFHGHSATFADAKTYVSTINSQSLVVMGNNKIIENHQVGPSIMSYPSWDSAYFQGLRARRLTPGAPIADHIVAQGGPLDSFGGPHTASLPYFNSPMRDTIVTPPRFLFSGLEQDELEDAGFSTFGVNSALNTMITGPIVTTRVTDSAGNENASFHYLNFVDTTSACREIFYRTLKSTFAQSKLTDGNVITGYSIANAETIKAECLRIYLICANLTLTQAGAKAENFFANNTTVTISLAQRLATITSLLPIVTQLAEINYTLTLSFTTGGQGVTTVV